MNGFILGFQRFVRWPKCTPVSKSAFIGTAGMFSPYKPLRLSSGTQIAKGFLSRQVVDHQDACVMILAIKPGVIVPHPARETSTQLALIFMAIIFLFIGCIGLMKGCRGNWAAGEVGWRQQRNSHFVVSNAPSVLLRKDSYV
jgi:hypothetical protein